MGRHNRNMFPQSCFLVCRGLYTSFPYRRGPAFVRFHVKKSPFLDFILIGQETILTAHCETIECNPVNNKKCDFCENCDWLISLLIAVDGSFRKCIRLHFFLLLQPLHF